MNTHSCQYTHDGIFADDNSPQLVDLFFMTISLRHGTSLRWCTAHPRLPVTLVNTETAAGCSFRGRSRRLYLHPTIDLTPLCGAHPQEMVPLREVRRRLVPLLLRRLLDDVSQGPWEIRVDSSK